MTFPTGRRATNAVYHKAEILELELVDHIVISNVSIDSKKPFYCSHLLCHAVCLRQHRRVENGAIYFVQNDMTYKAYKDVEPEIVKARDEFGADQKIEGLIQGEKNRTIEMAKSMLKDGTDINFIMKHTGLSKKDIKKI